RIAQASPAVQLRSQSTSAGRSRFTHLRESCFGGHSSAKTFLSAAKRPWATKPLSKPDAKEKRVLRSIFLVLPVRTTHDPAWSPRWLCIRVRDPHHVRP